MITGTSADSGADRNTFTHMLSRRSAGGTSPISSPSATPPTMASPRPAR